MATSYAVRRDTQVEAVVTLYRSTVPHVTMKRCRSASPADTGPHRPLSDLFQLPELFLRVLSFLSPSDLARTQTVNKHWARAALDPQLWKRLYLGKS